MIVLFIIIGAVAILGFAWSAYTGVFYYSTRRGFYRTIRKIYREANPKEFWLAWIVSIILFIFVYIFFFIKFVE